jgi:hypothetical protein
MPIRSGAGDQYLSACRWGGESLGGGYRCDREKLRGVDGVGTCVIAPVVGIVFPL